MNVAGRRGRSGEVRFVESVALRACGSEGEHTLERDGFVGGRREQDTVLWRLGPG